MRTISIGDLDVAEPQLLPEEIRVYLLDLRLLGERHEPLAASLSVDEHQRSSRFVRRADRQRFILVRGTLRHILGALAGQAPALAALLLFAGCPSENIIPSPSSPTPTPAQPPTPAATMAPERESFR